MMPHVARPAAWRQCDIRTVPRSCRPCRSRWTRLNNIVTYLGQVCGMGPGGVLAGDGRLRTPQRNPSIGGWLVGCRSDDYTQICARSTCWTGKWKTYTAVETNRDAGTQWTSNEERVREKAQRPTMSEVTFHESIDFIQFSLPATSWS